MEKFSWVHNEGHSEPETAIRISRASENYKKKVKSVNSVLKPAREILVELPNEEVSDPKSDTIIICTSKTYKNKVKWVKAVFK